MKEEEIADQAKYSTKNVIKTVLDVLFGVIIIIIFIIIIVGSYYFGIYQGYQRGYADAQGYIETIIEESSVEELMFDTGDSDNQNAPPVQGSPAPVSWGGPDLWQAVNEKRVLKGVNPISQRDDLCTIASIRLNELLALGTLDGHEGFSNLAERREDLAGIFEKYSNVAEFLALGGQTPQETVSMWENTLGHKKILTGGEYVWGCIYAQDTFAVAIAAF
jgi:hypothetical protein